MHPPRGQESSELKSSELNKEEEEEEGGEEEEEEEKWVKVILRLVNEATVMLIHTPLGSIPPPSIFLLLLFFYRTHGADQNAQGFVTPALDESVGQIPGRIAQFPGI